MPIYGTITPPADFGPAIEQLGDAGRAYLNALSSLDGGTITADMIAAAADYERNEHGQPQVQHDTPK